jgi:hypothetical protein
MGQCYSIGSRWNCSKSVTVVCVCACVTASACAALDKQSDTTAKMKQDTHL